MKRIQNVLTVEVRHQFPQAQFFGGVRFINKRFYKDQEGSLKPIIAIPLAVWMKAGNVDLKLETEVWPTYCPFCGKVISDDIEEGGEQ